MSKATLVGIATQPKYDDNDVWQGADIMADIEVETPDIQPGVTDVIRCGIKIDITLRIANLIKEYGYDEQWEDYIMKRVGSCLGAMKKRFEGTEKDADNIYHVIRLKLPRLKLCVSCANSSMSITFSSAISYFFFCSCALIWMF